jgi:UDP-3-O-[3-hydroxymyristoyl] glucosamine N-acyltransferase
MEFSAEIIANFLGGEVSGDKNITVNTLAKIEEGAPGALSFLSNPKYEHYIYTTLSSIVIVSKEFEPKEHISATLVKVDDPYSSFAKLLQLYIASKPQKTGVSPQAAISASASVAEDCYVGEFAVIGEHATVGSGTKIYPQVYIGDNVKVGSNTTIYAGVKIYEECVIGDNVVLHSGVVIGADGFGFAPNEAGGYDKIPQIGNVVIEDDVEIGANTCIDRATMGSTVICKGAKLDNLIQIGHNVVIGESTVFAAQTGIAGSSKVGAHCMFGGQVGVVGHITIGDNVQIGSQSGVSNHIEGGQKYFGTPALPASKSMRLNALYRRLPELNADVERLKKDIAGILEAQEQ